MVNDDPKSAMDAWLLARKALDATEQDLNAAKAGHGVALRCEREAWAAIAKICGRDAEPVPATPPAAAARARDTYGLPLQPAHVTAPHLTFYQPAHSTMIEQRPFQPNNGTSFCQERTVW